MDKRRRLKTPRGGCFWVSLFLWIVANGIVFASASSQVWGSGFKTPRNVEGMLSQAAERQHEGILARYFEWKKQVEANTGLAFGLDNYVQYLNANVSGDTTEAATNVFRAYGTWIVTGRNSPDNGALIFKIENRSAVGGLLSTQALGPTLGYAGLFSTPFSDAGWVLTNLYWRQRLLDERFSFIIGQIDTTDYVNVNNLANPWTGFTNLEFQQQSTYADPGQGLGAAFQWRFNDQWAVLAGFVNANADPSNPVDSAQQLFETGETFKHIAIGWTPDWKDRFDQSVQLTFWQIDDREEAGIEEGQGVSLLVSKRIGKWQPFLRAGYSDGGGTPLDRTMSIGTGYDAREGKDLAGIGFNWGRAPENDRNQYTIEAFYLCNATNFLQITPEVQFVANPANNPEEDNIWVYGIRVRLFI